MLRLKLLLMLPLFAFCWLPSIGQSATFYVDAEYGWQEPDETLGDGICKTRGSTAARDRGTPAAEGVCTFRAAIQEANALTGPDEIILPAIHLTMRPNNLFDDENAGGDYDIHSEITITGQGSTVLTADETDLNPDSTILHGFYDRIFDVHAGAKLTLSRLAVFNGIKTIYGNIQMGGGAPSTRERNSRGNWVSVGDAEGGAIRVFDGTLILNDVSITGSSINGIGGAIHADRSQLEINNSYIFKNGTTPGQMNRGGSAAGLFLTTTPTIIRDTTFESNFPAAIGGAILSAGELTIEGSAFINNYAEVDGGAIWHALGRMTIINSTFTGNGARRNGGAILFNKGDINFTTNPDIISPYIINSNFEGNNALGYENSGNDMAMDIDLGPSTIISDSGREIKLMDELSGIISMTRVIGTGGGAIAIQGQSGYANVIPIVNNSFVNNIGKEIDGYPMGTGDCWVSEFSELVSLGGNTSTDGSCGFNNSVANKALRKAGVSLEKTSETLELADNGGPTKTIAITAGSEYHNQGVQEYCPETDQRGFKRDAQCDIGAYELLPPGAFDAPYIAKSGDNLSGYLQVESRGSKALTYEIVESAAQGTVTLGDDGSFIYTADEGATESDSFSYRVCNESEACSETATISYNFAKPKEMPVAVDVIENSIAQVSQLDIVEEKELIAVKEDFDYDFPLGVFFFDVSKIETNEKQQVVIRMQLPSDEVISDASVVRQMDKEGNWVTLSSTPSSVKSFATINSDTNTLTLTLVDNDGFDSNPEKGAIRNPIGLGVPTNYEGRNLGAAGALGWFFTGGLVLMVFFRRQRFMV